MQTTKDNIEALNNLILINNHWIAGYEQAVNQLKATDVELKALFQVLQDQNQQDNLYLLNKLEVVGEKMEWVSVSDKKIFKAWREIKNIFKVSDKITVYKALHKAYKTALTSENIPAKLREMIEDQKAILKSSHDEIEASNSSKRRKTEHTEI